MILKLSFEGQEHSAALAHARRWLLDVERLAGGSIKTTGLPTLQQLEPGKGMLVLELPAALADDLAADLARLFAGEGLDRLRPSRARTLHRWQQQARTPHGVQRVKISLQGQPTLVVDASTGFAFQEVWVRVELYLYGVVTKMGGRGQPRLQIRDSRYGLRTLRCPRELLAGEERNRLYRYCGVHVGAQQNSLTGRLEAFEFRGFLEAYPNLDRAAASALFGPTA